MKLKDDHTFWKNRIHRNKSSTKDHLLGIAPHFSSSDLSAPGQSGTPSQTRDLSKQIPSTAHRNCSGGHWNTKENQKRSLIRNLFLVYSLHDFSTLFFWFFVHVPQLNSSEPSEQSVMLSHRECSDIQSPLLQRNWYGEQMQPCSSDASGQSKKLSHLAPSTHVPSLHSIWWGAHVAVMNKCDTWDAKKRRERTKKYKRSLFSTANEDMSWFMREQCLF